MQTLFDFTNNTINNVLYGWIPKPVVYSVPLNNNTPPKGETAVHRDPKYLNKPL